MYLDPNSKVAISTSNNLFTYNEKALKWAIAIILSLGCLSMLGCGIAGYYGALNNLDPITCYGLMGGGSAGLLAIIIGSVLLSKNQNGLISIWKKYGIITDEIPMPAEITEALQGASNLIPVFIPAITVKQLQTIAVDMGLEMEQLLSPQYNEYEDHFNNYLSNPTPYWVVWKTGLATDLSVPTLSMEIPEELQNDWDYEVPTGIEAAICLLAEFIKTGQLRPCTISCQELPRLTDTTNYFSIEAREQKITFKVYNIRIDPGIAGIRQRLIRRFKPT